MEEFALCWKNFQDNIADGFHGLFVRGDLVDVTLACGDGRLLQAHKTVLAICSPYFQEMFLTNPCKHPISEYPLPWAKLFCIHYIRGGLRVPSGIMHNCERMISRSDHIYYSIKTVSSVEG